MSGAFALSLLLKATLALTLSLAGYRLTRRARAAARHVLLPAAFAVLSALPVASLLLPMRVFELPGPAPSPAPVLIVPFIAADPARRFVVCPPRGSRSRPRDGRWHPAPCRTAGASLHPRTNGVRRLPADDSAALGSGCVA